jgi:hypothetical protein
MNAKAAMLKQLQCSSTNGTIYLKWPMTRRRLMLLERSLARVAVIVIGLVGANAPASGGSDRSSDTYADDYSGGSLPEGTFAVLQYLRFAHADAFFDTAGKELPNSHANIFVEFTRLAYISQIDGHPFVIEGDLPFATLTDVNVQGTNNRVAGGLVDPVLHFTYFFVTPDQEAQRWLGFTNYFYLPLGRSFDNQKAINIATARQFTDVLEIGYTECLGNFSHAMNGFFLI